MALYLHINYEDYRFAVIFVNPLKTQFLPRSKHFSSRLKNKSIYVI
jgi:hypothetical protein